MSRLFATHRLLFLLISIAVISVLMVACGSDGDSESAFSQVNPDPSIYSLESFAPAKFKKVKEYDVTGLPGAEAVYMGYYTPADTEPKQYELRFYPDHATAIASGVEYAAEVSGEDALLRSADVRWDEGTKDRRGGGAFRDSLTPLYGDYAVVGNVVMLCEGRNSEQSLERCEALILAAGLGVDD